jgi:hypothetical protein
LHAEAHPEYWNAALVRDLADRLNESSFRESAHAVIERTDPGEDKSARGANLLWCADGYALMAGPPDHVQDRTDIRAAVLEH